MRRHITGRLAFIYRVKLKKIGNFIVLAVKECMPMIMIVLLIMVWVCVAYKSCAPRASYLAVQSVSSNIQADIINYAVQALSDVGEGDLCNVEYADDGTISSVSADSVQVNNAVKSIISSVNEKMSGRIYKVGIPVGTLMGGKLLTGVGFKVNFRVEPHYVITSSTESTLESAGINQIVHTITLHIKADVQLVCMGEQSEFTTDVSLILSESVIIGKVPDGMIVGDIS